MESQTKQLTELTASNARLREALKKIGESALYKPWRQLIGQVLAESPAESLAAIQNAARAEEREKLDAGLREIAFHVPVCFEQSGQRYVSIEEVFSLKRIAADLSNRGNGEE